MYNKKPMPGRAYAGGSQNFSEAKGEYSQKPAMGKPATPKPPMTKPQARMQAMQKRFK